MDAIKCNELLHEIGTGNTKAFCELYYEMNKTIFSYAISLVRDKQLADDITQDVFIKIRLYSQKYAVDTNPIGWILTLTRNTAFDVLKKQKHEIPLDILPEDTSDFSSENMMDNILLKGALEKLSKLDRQVVILYLVAGISQKDIAKLLRLPISAVNWRYRSSIKKLAKILELGG